MEATSDPDGPVPLGVGIQGMSARIQEMGGRFEIRSNAKGTTVHVSVPVGPAAEELYVPLSQRMWPSRAGRTPLNAVATAAFRVSPDSQVRGFP
jgi:hypothetical protein